MESEQNKASLHTNFMLPEHLGYNYRDWLHWTFLEDVVEEHGIEEEGLAVNEESNAVSVQVLKYTYIYIYICF